MLGQCYGQSLIWTSYSTSNSNIIADDIKAVLTRSNGDIWIGHSSGINALVNGTWTSYNSFNVALPNDNINALAEQNNGFIWIGTDEGLVLFNGSTWTTYNTANSPLVQNRIISIEISDNGDVWAVSEGGGILRYSNSSFTLYNAGNSGFTGNGFLDIDTAPDGKVWAVGQNGAYFFANSTWSNLNETNPLFNSGLSSVGFEANGNVWIGTQNNGIIRYENPSYSLFQTGVTFLSSNSINDIKISSDGTVWIATSLGVSYYSAIQSGFYATSNSGLGNNDALTLAVATSGKVWIGTSLGLYTFCSSFIPVISSTNSQMCGTSQTTVLSVTSYSGYTYQWRLGGNPIGGATNNTFTASAAGTYSVVTTNTSGCIATSVSEVVTSNSPVSFITQPANVIGCPGTSAAISCLAKGCGLAYRWQEETSPNIWANLATTGTAYSNVTTSVLTINNVTNTMNGKRYRCRIQGTYVPTLAFSNPVTLTVNTTPILTLSNLPSPVCAPATVNATLITVSDANSSIGTISYLNANQNVISNPSAIGVSGTYFIRKTTTCGTIDQEQFTVVVNSSPIIYSNNPTPVCKPSFVDLTQHLINDSASTQGTLTYWSNRNCSIAFSRPDSIASGDFVYLVKSTNEGCSDTLELFVSVGTKIVRQPKNNFICSNGTAVFNVDARGIGLTYQWQEQDFVGAPWQNVLNNEIYSGANTNILSVSINGIQSFNQKSYRCKIGTTCSNPFVYSFPKKITILPDAQIITQPSDVITCSGEFVYLVGQASGVNLKYRWQRRTAITDWTNLTNGVNFEGVTNDTLTITGAKLSFSGHEYRMIAFSDCSSDTTNAAVLYVNATILSQSLNANACTSDTAYFSVNALGVGLTYQWQQQIGNGTFTNITNSVIFSGATTSVLQIAQPTSSMNGYNYRCKIFQTCALPIYSIAKKLNVWSNAGPITVLSSPIDASVCSGFTATFTCFASAPMTIHYQWQYFDVPQNKWLNISNNETYSGAKTNTLTIVANNSLDNLSYRCAVLANCPPLAISGVAVLDVVDCGLRGASALVDDDFITEVYPNPADNTINVRIVNTDVSYVRIEILDLEGRVVYSTKHNAQDGNNLEVDCSNYASGMYLMKINTDTKSEEFKIAVQHH